MIRLSLPSRFGRRYRSMEIPSLNPERRCLLMPEYLMKIEITNPKVVIAVFIGVGLVILVICRPDAFLLVLPIVLKSVFR